MLQFPSDRTVHCNVRSCRPGFLQAPVPGTGNRRGGTTTAGFLQLPVYPGRCATPSIPELERVPGEMLEQRDSP
jgi:hypothetical protein